MRGIYDLCEEFLRDTGLLAPAKLGGKPPPNVEAQKIRLFARRLETRLHRTEGFVWLLAVLYFIAFAFGVYAAFAFPNSPKLQAGTVGSLLLITAALRGFWKEKVALAMWRPFFQTFPQSRP